MLLRKLLVFSLVMILSISMGFGQITLVGEVATDYDVQTITKSGDLIYMGTGIQNRVLIADVSNPESPAIVADTIAGEWTGYATWGGAFVGDRLYVTCASSIAVLDVSDPATTHWVGGSEFGAFGYMPLQDLKYYNGYLYFTITMSDKLFCASIEDPLIPVELDRVECRNAWGMDFQGNYAYVAGHYMSSNSAEGMTIVDISNPEELTATGQILDPLWYNVDVAVVGDYAYVTQESGEGISSEYLIHVVDVSDPTSPTQVSSVALSTPPLYIDSYYQNLIVACRGGGISVLDISNPTSPVISGSYYGDGDREWHYDVVVSNEYAYVAAGDRLLVLDLSSVLNVEEDEALAPVEFSLHPAYPNPFNSSTRLSYSLKQNAIVKLNVYNLLGRQVASLVNDNRAAGTHEILFDAENMAAGIYMIHLSNGTQQLQQKVIYLK